MFVEEERDPVAPDVPDVVALVALDVGAGGVPLERLPLKAGMGWMNMDTLLAAAASLPGGVAEDEALTRAGGVFEPAPG